MLPACAVSRENGVGSRLNTRLNISAQHIALIYSGYTPTVGAALSRSWRLGRLEERLRHAQRGIAAFLLNDSSGPKLKALGPLTLAPLPLLEVRDRLLDKAEVGGLVEARAEEVAREIGLEQAPEVRAGVKVGRG